MAVPRYVRLSLPAAALPCLIAVAALQRGDPLAEPFKGVTAEGTIVPGLFSVRSTGVTTAPVRAAAVAF